MQRTWLGKGLISCLKGLAPVLADSVFGVPSAHLLEIGLPYTLQHI